MASKNLGAVIQRAISDGAFRRQLQSDPATALRGFNLTPDEVAAIRSGDSGKLISLGVDQRMSKVFAVSGMQGGAARQSVSDLAAGSTSSTIANDPTSGAREGIVGDPTSGQRSALDTDASGNTRSAFTPGDVASTSDAHTTGSLSGTRAIFNTEPVDTRGASTDATLGGTRAIHNTEPTDIRGAVTTGDPMATRAMHEDAPVDIRSAASTGDLSGTRAVNDVAPFGSTGTSALEDPNSPEFAAAQNAGSGAAGSAALSDPYSGQYQGVSPDFQARMGQAAASDGAAGGSGGNQIAADDNYAVSSRMAESGDMATRAIHDDAPFEGNANAAAPSNEFLGGDARLDPGTDSAHGFIPSDSADVQREMLEGGDHGNALGNTGGGHPS
jgi:hypothetical protein